MAETDEYELVTRSLDGFGKRLVTLLKDLLADADVSVDTVAYRVKSRANAYRKIRDHPDKYSSITELTDLLGIRIITYFPDQVDQVGRLIDSEFKVDIERSTDKRVALDADRFGYISLHRLARLNDARAAMRENSKFKTIAIEFQIRSVLQHAWAEIEHDLGYKSAVAVPLEVRRRFSRLAGLLEIADSEFQAIRNELSTYTTRVTTQIKIGLGNLLLDRVSLIAYIEQKTLIADLDSKMALIFRSHLEAGDEVSLFYADGIVRTLSSLGVGNIEDLDQKLTANADALVEFAVQWAKIGENRSWVVPDEMPHGITLFYLALVLANEVYDDDTDLLGNWAESVLELDRSIGVEIRDAYLKAEI